MRNFIIKGFNSQRKDDLGKTLFESAKRSEAQQWVRDNPDAVGKYRRVEMGVFVKEKVWNAPGQQAPQAQNSEPKAPANPPQLTAADLDAELAQLEKVTKQDVERLAPKYDVSEATIRRRFGNLKKE